MARCTLAILLLLMQLMSLVVGDLGNLFGITDLDSSVAERRRRLEEVIERNDIELLRMLKTKVPAPKAGEGLNRSLCYGGSDLYQQVTMNCGAHDPSYQGIWLCARVSVCEQFMSPERVCVVTK